MYSKFVLLLLVVSAAPVLNGSGFSLEASEIEPVIQRRQDGSFAYNFSFYADTLPKYLASNPDTNLRDKNGKTPLLAAIEGGFAEAVDALLAVPGIDASIPDRNGNAPLMFAYRNENVVEKLLKRPEVDVNARDDYGRTALMFACLNRAPISLINTLISKSGVGVNLQDKYGNTALILACKEGNHSAVEALLASGGIDANLENPETGETPLVAAIRSRSWSAVSALIASSKVDVNHQGDDCWTALMEMANLATGASFPTGLFKELIAKSGKKGINLQNEDENTALMLACDMGNEPAIKALLESEGIDIYLTNNDKKTAKELVRKKEIKELFEQKEREIQSRT